MGLHLVLGLHHKPQAHPVSQPPRQQAHAKGPCVPKRVQQGRALPQFIQSLPRPGQVVGFFGAGLGEMLAQGIVLCGKGLRRVQRLGAYLPHMVHPH